MMGASSEVVHYGLNYARLMFLSIGFSSISSSLSAILRGAGDTRFALYSTLIGVWGVRVLLSYLFVYIFSWGMFGLWNADACDQFLRSNLIYFRFKRMVWKHVKI